MPMHKAPAILLTTFVASSLLLINFSAEVFGQNGREKNSARFLETERQAEGALQEALVLSRTGERESARQGLSDAMRLWLLAGLPEKAARGAIQMGDSFKQAKKLEESLFYYRQALEVRPLSNAVKAIAFTSIAEIYVEAYQLDLGLHYYNKSISHARKAGDFSTQALAFTNLAALYYQKGERNAAISSIARARKLHRRQGNDDAEAALLYLEGRINPGGGMAEQAREDFEQALAIYQRTGNVEGQVKVLCSISDFYLSSARNRLALDRSEQAVAIAERQAERAVTNTDKLRARELRGRAWLSHGRAQRASGQKELAITSFSRSVHHMEGVWWMAHISTETSAVAFREEIQAPYRELVDLTVEKGLIDQAYEWAERARGRAFMGMTQARRAMGLPKNPDQERALRESSRSLARMRTELLSSELGPEQQSKLQWEIREAEYKIVEMQLRAEMERARERLVWFQPATAKQLPEKDTVLEYLIGESRSFVWLISPQGISLEILPGRKEIEEAVKQYIEAIRVPPDNRLIERDLPRLKEKAEKLFSTLFGRFSGQILPGRKLIIVPDGLLYYLPFEALVHKGRYLIEDHEISYLPSVSMRVLSEEPKGKAESEKNMELLAFGDPTFGPGPKVIRNKEMESSLRAGVRQVRISRGFQLAPLSRTRDEVQGIAGLFPSDRSRVYLGKESTEEAVKQESLRQYRRLHFATHSLIDEASPSQSAVVLTLDNDPEEDGFLEASEIARLDLDCDLVVLSACQTGRGKLLSGEGILGLSRAFLYAGARSVVVSLWDVTDISTGELMKGFYKNMTGDQGNAAALRQAKLQMLQEGKWTHHPYYWSPFILVGKP
jgi:CHAT domain-containing protein